MKKNIYADTPFEEQPRPNVALLEPKIVNKYPSSHSEDKTPVVTVVTVVFGAVKGGRKEQLLQCLDSVQAQTGTTIEHLIIDGASADGTVELIKNYRNENVPIRLLSEPDAGIYDAMNRGVWLARGKYVIFLNSDDYYSNPNGLVESVKCLEESHADFSYAPICVLSEKTGLPVPHLITQPNINMIFIEMPFSHQSMMIRREVMLKINGFDLRYSSGADYDSVLRMIFTGHHACYVPCCFVTFRLGGFSFVNVGQSQEEVGTIFSRLYKKYLDFDISREEGREIYVTKRQPKELWKMQYSYAKAAFGDAIFSVQDPIDDTLKEDLLTLRYRLQVIKNRPGFFTGARVFLRLIFSSPVLLCRLLLIFLQVRRKLDTQNAGKEAYLRLYGILREKRIKKMNSSSKDNGRPSDPVLSKNVISCRDFWHTNGLYVEEPWGAWTGRKFSVFFKIPKENVGYSMTVKIFIGGYVFPESPKRIVDVVVNGCFIDSLTVDNVVPQPHQFKIPRSMTLSASLDIDFIADKAFSPKTLGHTEDTRELGMSFWKLSFQKIDGSNEIPEPSEMQEIKVGFLNHFNKWWVGGITYFKNLFQAMATTESPHLQPFIFPSPDKLADCLTPYVSKFPDSAQTFSNLSYLPTAADYHMDVLSHLNGNQVAEGCDGIAWIADFQHVHLPEMFDEQEIAFRNHSFHTLIDSNRLVCLSSRDAMEDFKEYAPEAAHKARCLHFVSIPESDVYHISEKEAAEIRRNRQLPERYFYVPNQFWKHKNHIAVLKAISILKKSGLSIHVVFSGNTTDSRFPHYFEELEEFCRREQIEENVHFLGLIPLKEVYFLMRDCLAMINPSKFEGWSSSVEEAKSIGKTIFLSNLNVHYEQMPPRGIYFPCDDPMWLADILKRAWNEMSPGPDFEMEKEAQTQLPLRIKQFGKDFQRIVLDAMENKKFCKSALQDEPQVTVVTVIREFAKCGGKEQLIRNMESVAGQKDVVAEHLIVENSLDEAERNSLQPYLKKYGCRIISEPVHGIYGAMNLGTIQARGKYVAYLSYENCYAEKKFLNKSVSAMEKGDFDFSYVTESADETKSFVEMPFLLQSMLFLRKALYSIAIYNDTFTCIGEHDLLMRLILSGKKGIRVNDAGTSVSEGISSRSMTEQAQREYQAVFTRLCTKLGYNLTPEEWNFLNRDRKIPKDLEKILLPYFAVSFGASRPDLRALLKKTNDAMYDASQEAVPLVSVILPLDSCARFLKERISSIRMQDFKDFEVIVVEFGLVGENMRMIETWKQEDKRVRLYHAEKNLKNFGLLRSRGKYVYFALNGQTMSPECLGHMAAALNEHPECSICDSRLRLIDQQGNVLSGANETERYFGHLSYQADREHVRQAPYDFFQAMCGKKVYTSLGQLMVRKTLFDATGDFPEDVGNSADYLWSLFASFHANVVYLPEYLCSMRLNLNPQNLSDGICWDFDEINQCVRRFLKRMPESEIKTTAYGLATMLAFKQILLPLKSSVSLSKRFICYLKAVNLFPKKSLELVFYMMKFCFRRGEGGSTSVRANNALIAARMKKYQWLIRYGKIAPYSIF